MNTCRFFNVFAFVLALTCLAGAAFASDAPTVDAILKIHRDNQAKLDPLHVQFTQMLERSKADEKKRQKEAEQIEGLVKFLESKEGAEELKRLSEEYGYSLDFFRQEATQKRMFVGPMPKVSERSEYFIRGDEFQVRTLLRPHEERKWENVAVTPVSLVKEYAFTRIYSQSPRLKPHAHIWPGQPRAESAAYAMISSKHVRDSQVLHSPPYANGIKPTWDMRHPIDTFYAAPAESYRVFGTEEKDGKTLTIVDVMVPTELTGGTVGDDGEPKTEEIAYWYRAWLDLKQGGVPVKMHFWYGNNDKKAFDDTYRSAPQKVFSTNEIRQLENGAYYPIVTVEEGMQLDPEETQPTEAEWKEIRAHKRETPPYVVHQRTTWTCELVDTAIPGDENFFVLEFPKGQPLYDLDTQKVAGALEQKPFIKAGDKAPEWKIARWLDGKTHTLEEFRGKVVFVDFWGTWCSACRSSVPSLVALQDKYKDKPVVFVSIHSAEPDAAVAEKRIQEFTAANGWKFLAAIDAGKMLDNSETSHAYGCTGFPTQLIIGPDGVVQFDSSEPPPGMEDVMGKSCDEMTPEDVKKLEAWQKEFTEAAGEKWPIDEHMSQQDQKELMTRVNLFHMSRKIDAALRKVAK